MAEKEPSIAHDPLKIAEALGASSVIYVGQTTPSDIFTGAVLRRVEEHKQAREIAGREEEADNIFGRHLVELVELADSGFDRKGRELTREQREIAAKTLLLATQARQAVGGQEPSEDVVERLSVWYWLNQSAIQETRLAAVLRQLPEDYGIDQQVDFNLRGEIFRDASKVARLVHTRGEFDYVEY